MSKMYLFIHLYKYLIRNFVLFIHFMLINQHIFTSLHFTLHSSKFLCVFSGGVGGSGAGAGAGGVGVGCGEVCFRFCEC